MRHDGLKLARLRARRDELNAAYSALVENRRENRDVSLVRWGDICARTHIGQHPNWTDAVTPQVLATWPAAELRDLHVDTASLAAVVEAGALAPVLDERVAAIEAELQPLAALVAACDRWVNEGCPA